MSGAKPARITLLCHAATAAMRAGRFPTPGDPLDAVALDTLRGSAIRLKTRDRCWTSPARRAVETASVLGLPARPEPLLDDADPGRWAGKAIADVQVAEPDCLAEWLSGMGGAPHGGEAWEAVAARVAGWLDAQDGDVLAVTHAAIIRAAVASALEIPPAAAMRIDVAPLGLTGLSGMRGRWRLGCLNLPLAKAATTDGARRPGLR